MKYRSVLLLTLVAVLCRPAAAIEERVQCMKSASFLAPIDSPDYRKYAPDRDVQVLHLALDVIPDFKQRSVEGKAEIKFKTNAGPVAELRLDAVDLAVSSVTATEKIKAWQVTESNVIVTFENPLPDGKEASVTVAYKAQPQA